MWHLLNKIEEKNEKKPHKHKHDKNGNKKKYLSRQYFLLPSYE